jgi:ribose transport system ATP-binding protein
MRTEPKTAPLLRIRGLSKAFGGARALTDVDLEVLPAEVHGLLGENGSGKSTLIKILAGFHAPDAGELEVRGVPVRLPLSPGQFRQLGMEFVHQDLGLIPSLTVLENLRVGAFAAPARSLYVSWKRERQRAVETFRRYGVRLDPMAKVQELTPVDRAMLAIIRAVEDMARGLAASGVRHGLLLLDEPTAFLPKDRVDELFALVRQVVAGGASVVLVSHDLEEVRHITDRITVLRSGRNAGVVSTRDTSVDELVRLIVGRGLEALAADHRDSGSQGVVVSVEQLSGGAVRDVALQVHAGEVLGVTGLLGSGFEDVAYLLYGARPARSGRIALDGRVTSLVGMTPSRAIEAGLALIPADRLNDGSVGSLPAVENMMIPAVTTYFSRGLLRRRAMLGESRRLMDRFDIRPRDPTLPYASLSGGNQQKALLAKWLHTRPRLLLVHEPTVGVDVGARLNIISLIRESAAAGTAVVCASADYEQLAQLCDRVLVFARGRVVQELSGDEVTKERVTEQCLRSVQLAVAAGSAQAEDAGVSPT